jgi:hypothetical protein
MVADKSAENTPKFVRPQSQKFGILIKKDSLGVRSPRSKTFKFFDNIAVLKNLTNVSIK